MQPRHSLKFCFIDGVEAAEQSPPHKSHSRHQKLGFTEFYIYYIFIYVHKTYMFLLKKKAHCCCSLVCLNCQLSLFTFYCPDKHCDQMQIGEDIIVYSLSWWEVRLLSSTTQDHLPRVAPHTSQENAPQTCLFSQLDIFSQLVFPLLRSSGQKQK